LAVKGQHLQVGKVSVYFPTGGDAKMMKTNDIMREEEQKDDFYPFMKVSLEGRNGVVTAEVRTGMDRSHYGVIRWDSNNEAELEDWRGLWETFIEMGGHEIGRDYQFRFINDDGTLKGGVPPAPAKPTRNRIPAATFKIYTSFNITTRGVVAYGIILDGKILLGYSAVIDINGQSARVRITGRDMGRVDDNGNMQLGLLLEFENKELEKIASIDKIKEQTIAIYRNTISFDDLNAVLRKLQRVLRGNNYVVTLGVEVFNNCDHLEEVKLRIKNTFPHSKPESVVPVPMTQDEFWEDIENGLEYRGDESAGLRLSESGLRKFSTLKLEYINFLRDRIEPDSGIYAYPDESGIPGYPVWWDFRYIILSPGSDALFVYGSASD